MAQSPSTGEWTVAGDGADIWGTADAFHYVYEPLAGGAIDLTTHVDSVENVEAWTKAGLMIRGTLDASSLQASIFITPGKGAAFQWRIANGGTSSRTSAAGVTAPVWLRLTYDGTTVRAFYKKNATDLWGSFGSLSFAGSDTAALRSSRAIRAARGRTSQLVPHRSTGSPCSNNR